MTERPIETVLQDESHIEKSTSKTLRRQALFKVNLLESGQQSTAQLPETLLDLITQIIKPLFSEEHHSKLTSTGRKNLVNVALPASVNRFSPQILFDDDASRPLWKNGWTASLLLYILHSYEKLTDDSLRKKTLEAQFHLLVPPILHQIDDVDISYKCYGRQCLKLLCDNLYDVQSEILKKSGLTDVFIEALRNDFSLLPTLTPEGESLLLLKDLYPAYRSLVQARFPQASPQRTNDTPPSLNPTATTDSKANAKQEAKHTGAEEDQRQAYLTTLLRHQLLHSLHHLATGTGLGTTISVPLSTFLISQLAWIFTAMGLHSAVHLQTVLPLLRNVLTDPFATSAPDMLLAAARSLQTIVAVTWPRIRAKWWGEALRGVVGCWVNVCDEESDIKIQDREQERPRKLREVKHELKVLACLLEDVVGEDFVAAKQELIGEEPMLDRLFDGEIGGECQRASLSPRRGA